MKHHKENSELTRKRQTRIHKAVSRPRFLTRLTNWLEENEFIRIWVRINQSLTAFSFFIASIGFLLAVYKYNNDRSKADEDRIAKAWDVVTRMAGKQSNGGQVAAIESLNSMKISLNNIDLHNTYLASAHLKSARLQNANFSGAVLIEAHFDGADLQGANFRNAILIGADLTDAILDEADFSGSKIINARIDISIVLAKSLLGADLTSSIFVFEGEEGGAWGSFSDTIAEAMDDKDMQRTLESACANPKAPPKINEQIGIYVRYKRCSNEPNYQHLSLKYPSARGVVPYGFVTNPFSK